MCKKFFIVVLAAMLMIESPISVYAAGLDDEIISTEDNSSNENEDEGNANDFQQGDADIFADLIKTLKGKSSDDDTDVADEDENASDDTTNTNETNADNWRGYYRRERSKEIRLQRALDEAAAYKAQLDNIEADKASLEARVAELEKLLAEKNA